MAAYALLVKLCRAEGISRNLVRSGVHVIVVGLSGVFLCGSLSIE
jgi:hypothetical protein